MYVIVTNYEDVRNRFSGSNWYDFSRSFSIVLSLDTIMVFVRSLSSASCELRCWIFSSFSFKDLEVQ